MKAMRRRRFLEATVGGFLGATSVGRADATAGPSTGSTTKDSERERLERLLRTYGSELGPMRRIRTSEEGR